MSNCFINKVLDTNDQNTRRTRTEVAIKKEFVREFKAYVSVACIAVSAYLLSLVLFS